MRSSIAQALMMFTLFASCEFGQVLEVGLIGPFNQHPLMRPLADGIRDLAADQSLSSHGHRWVPGYVIHNSYVPAHLDHIYFPRASKRISIGGGNVQSSEFRRHYGGFGIGVDAGGRGAGHGFYAVYDY